MERRMHQGRRNILGALASCLGLAAAPSVAAARRASRETAVLVLAELNFASVEDVSKASVLAAEVAAATRAEEGCVHYAYGVDVNVPTRLQLSEWWRDAAALDAHLRTSHLRTFRLGLRELGGSSARVRRFEVSAITELKLPPLD